MAQTGAEHPSTTLRVVPLPICDGQDVTASRPPSAPARWRRACRAWRGPAPRHARRRRLDMAAGGEDEGNALSRRGGRRPARPARHLEMDVDDGDVEAALRRPAPALRRRFRRCRRPCGRANRGNPRASSRSAARLRRSGWNGRSQARLRRNYRLRNKLFDGSKARHPAERGPDTRLCPGSSPDAGVAGPPSACQASLAASASCWTEKGLARKATRSRSIDLRSCSSA